VDIDGGQTVLLHEQKQHHQSRRPAGSRFTSVIHVKLCRDTELTFNIGYNIPRRMFRGIQLITGPRCGWKSIDTSIDSTRIPNFGNTNATLTTTTRPTWIANYSDYFAQGLNFGLHFKW
jgi:hypothetical protein